MKGTGQAVAHGAVSIINAFATGKGGAMGIDLWTRSRVSLKEHHKGVSGFVTSDPSESSELIVTVAEKTLEHYGYAGKVGGEVVTTSNLPIAVGLKSSSAAANATALATAAALGEQPDEDVLLEIGVESSLQSGVSLTGALDDSYASYHGGVVLADNLRRKVEKVFNIPRDVRLLLLVPQRKRYTGTLNKSQFKPIQRIVDIAYREALAGNIWDAMTLNGFAYSTILQEDLGPAIAALRAGAVGVGLTGKGPTIVSVVEGSDSERVKQALSIFPGKVVETTPNQTEALIEDLTP